MTPEVIGDVAAWMLTDPRAREGVAAFTRSWLRLDDLGSVQKPSGVMSGELVASMQKEAPTFAVAVVLDGDAKYDTLMRAPFTYVDEVLARHYGLTGVTGSQMERVDYGIPDRLGILTGAGVLARFSGTLDPPWPPRRYWLVYETLLCDSARIPPAIPQSNRLNPELTIREDLDLGTDHAPCNSCHVTVNPIGYTFSKFDTFGRYRPLDERGSPIDTEGIVPAGLSVTSAFVARDAPDLIDQLTKRPEVRRCFSARWLQYALNPMPIDAAEPIDALSLELQCDLTQAHAAFEASGGDIRKLLVAIAQTGAFLGTR